MNFRPALVTALAGLALASTVTPAAAAPTSGSGGPQTDRTFVQYTNPAGTRGEGHVFAAGLDWSKPVGMWIYGDGSAEYGLDYPNDPYLLGGVNGLKAKAKAANSILVTPMAPGAPCNDGDGDCWYDHSGTLTPTQKTQWAFDFIQSIRAQYPEDNERMVLAGYSSGAQLATEYLGPKFGEQLSLDLIVAISYGGRPIHTPTYSATTKANTPVVWDVGSLDPAWQNDGVYDAQSGYDAYGTLGFATRELNVVQGEDHARDGQFGAIVAREAAQHIPTNPVAAPAAWDTTVDPSRTGGSFTTNVPAGYSGSVYVKLSDGSYVYETGQVGPKSLTQTFSTRECGTTYGWTVEAPSGTVRDSGTFTTDAC